jgi:hypothetical protein
VVGAVAEIANCAVPAVPVALALIVAAGIVLDPEVRVVPL